MHTWYVELSDKEQLKPGVTIVSGGVVVSTVASRQEFLDQISPGAFLGGVCKFSPCMFSLGSPAAPLPKNVHQ